MYDSAWIRIWPLTHSLARAIIASEASGLLGRKTRAGASHFGLTNTSRNGKSTCSLAA